MDPPIIEKVLSPQEPAEEKKRDPKSSIPKSAGTAILINKITKHKFVSDKNIISMKDIKRKIAVIYSSFAFLCFSGL